MKKLKLELNELRVESFGTQAAEESRGTVDGRAAPTMYSCEGTCVETCNSCVNSCYNTCQQSCGWETCNTCAGTCQFHCTHISECGG